MLKPDDHPLSGVHDILEVRLVLIFCQLHAPAALPPGKEPLPPFTCILKSSGISASIQTGYGLKARVRFPGWGNNGIVFLSPSRPNLLWGPPTPISKEFQGILPPRVKRMGRETYSLHPSSAEVKNAWMYTFTTPNASSWRGDKLSNGCVFIVLCLVT
jgi:hypothetical protein